MIAEARWRLLRGEHVLLARVDPECDRLVVEPDHGDAVGRALELIGLFYALFEPLPEALEALRDRLHVPYAERFGEVDEFETDGHAPLLRRGRIGPVELL